MNFTKSALPWSGTWHMAWPIMLQRHILQALTVLSAVSDDPDDRLNVYTTMGEATRGGSSMSHDTKQNVFDMIKHIETNLEASKRHRRRRSVDSDNIQQVDKYSASQVICSFH